MEATRSEERAARNEVLFREANEKLEGKRQALDNAIVEKDGVARRIAEEENPRT